MWFLIARAVHFLFQTKEGYILTARALKIGDRRAINAGQNNLAKTSDCIFLSRKGDISEFSPPPVSMTYVVLEVFVCGCTMTSTLILGEGEA